MNSFVTITFCVCQVFRGLDVGSAKVEKEVREKMPHHLLDVADIWQLFNSADYCHLAEQALQVSQEV